MTFGCRIFFAALFSFTSSSSVSETSPFLSSSSHRHHQHSRRQQQHNHNSYHNKRQHPPPHDRHILTVGSLDGGGSGGGSGRSSIAALAAFRGGSSGQQRRTATATKTTASTIATNEAKEEATVTLPAGFALTATAAANSNQSFSGGYHHDAGEVVWKEDPSQSRGPLRVLFLSSDTGGGHRASAESLAKQFQIEFPGSTYDLLDVWTADGVLPYRTLVKSYQHLSAHPRQWRVLFHASNTRPWELLMDWHSTLMCERRIRRRIASYNPDVVVSVHPAMNNAPMIAVRKISKKAGRHIPFFTVVTDLASGHCTWFQKRVEKIYVASERLHLLAQRRGRTPPENIRMAGLPIRVDFARQAAAMGDRTAPNGLQYQSEVKRGLGLDPSKPMVLLMGGGEGVGSLERITDELYASLVKHGVDATICVVCGRNDKLRTSLAERDWDALLKVKAEEEEAAASQLGGQQKRGRLRRLFSRAGSLRRQSRSREIQESVDKTLQEEETAVHDRQGKVDVVGLGFVTNMADYMVAADVLVSKAGPGTIAEAASLGLPVMLTSFLPGQEAGNVDFVLECGFGDYCDDPLMIGEEVACWLQDPALLQGMSRKAQLAGRPDAALDIVRDIGGITHTWMALNGPSPVDTSTLDL